VEVGCTGCFWLAVVVIAVAVVVGSGPLPLPVGGPVGTFFDSAGQHALPPWLEGPKEVILTTVPGAGYVKTGKCSV